MSRQLRPLSSFIEEYLFSIEEGDYHKYLKKQKALLLAKQGIRSMAGKVTGVMKSLLLDVNSVGFVSWPSDFVRYTKIGYLNASNQIVMLTRKDNINIASEYMTSGSNIMYDADGIELLDRTTTLKTRFNGPADVIENVFWNIHHDGHTYHRFGLPGNKNSKGYYRIDEQYGIELSSDYIGSQIILEYLGDSTMASDPMIPIEAEDALRSWIYWQAIVSKANVPEYHKQMARRTHYNDRRVAIRNKRRLTLDEILQGLRENSGKQTVKQ